MIEVVVLVSVGRHPVSGRPRRSPLDARALELALRLPGAAVRVIHAGVPDEPALRDYLGMGLDRLTVLALPPGCDPVPVLAAHLGQHVPDLLLTGARGEGGEDSGMVPYLMAQSLGCALIPDAVGIAVNAGKAEVIQALPRGRRRLIATRTPVVVTAHAAAPDPRPSAFARARRGVIAIEPATALADEFLTGCDIRPWRPRPKLLRVARGGTALDRLKAATETKTGKGRLLVQPDPEEAAAAIFASLVEQGTITP
jgi:electron transfer flavoprotein beta subunit